MGNNLIHIEAILMEGLLSLLSSIYIIVVCFNSEVGTRVFNRDGCENGGCSMFRRFNVPKVLYSEVSIFRRFYAPKVLYSEGSMFRRFYIPKVLCSENPLPTANIVSMY